MNSNKSAFKPYNIWLPVLSVVLFFGLIEILVRISGLADQLETNFKFYVRNVDNNLEIPYYIEDPILMWSPKPNFKKWGVEINSEGYRDRLYKIRKDDHTFRILALGDSSTFGHRMLISGVYHSLLEQKLNKEYGGKINFEVINGGVEGYSSYQGLSIYKYKFLKYKPDIVTAYFGINDVWQRFHLSDKDIMGDGSSVILRIINNRFLLNLSTYRLLMDLTSNFFKSDNDNLKTKVPRVSLSDYRENIVELNEIAKKNGSSLVLISPALNASIRGTRFKSIILYREELESVAKKYNIPLLTVGEMTEKMWRSRNRDYFIDSVHPSYLGNQLLMERLYDFLLGLRLLPTPN